MTPYYDPRLVIVSVAIAVMASYVSLDFAVRLSDRQGSSRRWWRFGGSVAMGLGIWSMHFVGMLAFRLPMTVHYDATLVLLSVVVAIGASAVALSVVARPALSVTVLAVASVFMAAGISGMHYIGMAAMNLSPAIVWHVPLVALSIAIALVASFFSLLMGFRVRRTRRRLVQRVKFLAALAMGAAIAGMHYTGMAAATFAGATASPRGGMALHSTGVAVGVIVGTVLILSMALVSAALEERAGLLERERQARQAAESANRLKDEFLATLSHELRTPLNVILGRTQMLQRHATDSAKVLETAAAIVRNGEALRHVVEDLLDVSRMTLGGMHLDRQPVDVAALLVAASASLQHGAIAKGVTLSIDATPGLPHLLGDPARLQQIIWNLLTNAVKFTPAGGEVRVRLWRDAHHLVLSVADTGCGIDREFLPHVFDLFRQAEPAASRTQGGLGIGLSIVRRLVELHGGHVTAGSAGPGRGATFTVLLPLQSSRSPQAKEISELPLLGHAAGTIDKHSG